MFKNFFFLKIEEWNRGHPFFFSCIIAQKKPKIQTHCGKWSWRINKKGFLMNFRCSQFFFKSERAEAVSVKGILEITAWYWYQTRPLTWLNMLRPKGKTLHCFCDNDLWQTGKNSVRNINSIAGAMLVCYAAVLLGRHATLQSLWGERETKNELFSLTTSSLNGGWVLGVSRGFHFRHPTPRLNNAPMVGTTAQPSHEPPHERKQTGTRVTEKYQWGKNHWEGDENGWKKPRGTDNTAGRKISMLLNHARM